MPVTYFSIETPSSLSLKSIEKIIRTKQKLKLSASATAAIEKGREYLEKKINQSANPVYGINTGFGSLCNVKIASKELEKLQENLVKSHACGTGDEVPAEIVRLMLLLKIQGLSHGNSGVNLATVERLIFFYNENILPVIYQQGSLGASGDLAPLAHLSLPLLGMGEVFYKGIRRNTEEVYRELKLKPLKLQSKEGLALLNGTQFMSAYGIYILLRSKNLMNWADVAAGISLDAFDGRIDPFSNKIQEIRPHKGQIKVAKNIRNILKGSEIINQVKKHVQDPYAFRCVPQVHGATRDTFTYAESVFVTEINSVTDNPTIFPESDEIISGGNFHGQPLALALDFLCIALSEIGSISERRIYQLISGLRDLPPFLVKNAGLNSGFMIPQYTAASIASQSKQLCTPASADSIVSSNGQEDHVSMGANAATKCFRVLENSERILAIEIFNAFQALEFRKPLKSSPVIEKLKKKFRSLIPFIEDDKIMYQEIEASLQFLKNNLVLTDE